MRKLRVLALVHKELLPPDNLPEGVDPATQPWRTEYDVVTTLRGAGHEVKTLGIGSDLGLVRVAIEEFKPHVAFNLLEEFHGEAIYDQNVVSYLELQRVPYTGCNPRGIMLARDKAISKKVLTYHRIRVPDFVVFPMKQRIARPRRLEFPLMVKSLVEESSFGIAQASLVRGDEALRERVLFVHEKIGTDAIVEQYIEGRELYVSLLGDRRLTVLPVWELLFTRMPEETAHIATAKVKWDFKYQEKHGIRSERAQNLPPALEERIRQVGKRVYRSLMLSGYARIDLRLTDDEKIYVLEANPNPQLAYGEDFAESAHAAGISYAELLVRIIRMALRRRNVAAT